MLHMWCNKVASRYHIPPNAGNTVIYESVFPFIMLLYQFSCFFSKQVTCFLHIMLPYNRMLSGSRESVKKGELFFNE